jgi:hypothetical protein
VIGIEASVRSVGYGRESIVIHEIVGGETDYAPEDVRAFDVAGDGEF